MNKLPIAGLILTSTILASCQKEPQLSPSIAYDNSHPIFSPDGAQIIFESDKTGNLEIFKIDASGSDLVQLTSTTGRSGFPRVSADGSMVIFHRFDTESDDPKWQIYQMNSDGSQVQKVRTDSLHNFEGTWSHDQSAFAFIRSAPEMTNLWISRENSTEPLTDDHYRKYHPSFSPDGRKIIIGSRGPHINYEIYLIDVVTGEKERITESEYYDNTQPSWSPTGDRVAFVSNRDGNNDIYIMNADGSDQVQVTHTDYWSNRRPSWSPNGKKIVFDSDRNGSQDIYMVNVDGSELKRITHQDDSDFVRYLKNEGVVKAKALYQTQIKLHQKDPFFTQIELESVGSQWLMEGEISEALSLFQFITDIYDNSYAYTGLGYCLAATGELPPPTSNQLLTVLQSEGIEAAQSIYEKAKQRYPNWRILHGSLFRRLGYNYLRDGRPKEAAFLFQLLIEEYDQPDAHEGMSEVKLLMGDTARALEYRKYVYDSFPDYLDEGTYGLTREFWEQVEAEEVALP